MNRTTFKSVGRIVPKQNKTEPDIIQRIKIGTDTVDFNNKVTKQSYFLR